MGGVSHGSLELEDLFIDSVVPAIRKTLATYIVSISPESESQFTSSPGQMAMAKRQALVTSTTMMIFALLSK